jgi:urease accessory protein UreH
VDTSAFKEKAASIINNSGVLNMGGRLEMSNAAVGKNSQVQIQMQAQANATAQSGGSS